MDSNSDQDLMTRVSRGDQRAMELVERRHRTHAMGVAHGVLRNSTLAEDAVQEAMLHVWRTAARFDASRGSLRTWICVLAHRRAVDLVRRETRRRVADGTAAALDPESYAFDEMVILASEQRQVREALHKLSGRNRQLIELAYFAGLTRSEVAERLGLPVGTVKSATFYALQKLRSVLEERQFAIP